MKNKRNFCILSDGYKIVHNKFYPKSTKKVYSYFESRSGARFNQTVFYGLQKILKDYFVGEVVTGEDVARFELLVDEYIKPGIINKKGWDRIVDVHGGKLPLEINAVPEGTPVDKDNVMMTVVNTDDKLPWLTNYVEPLLSHLWYPSSVATLSRDIKGLCNHYLDQTYSDKSNLEFMLHDFGFRGASSVESADMAGSAHLINFKGTDTMSSLLVPYDYYNATEMPGFSVEASEHSVMTSLGKNGEYEQAKHVIDNADDGVLSIVIDSYDYRDFLTTIFTEGYPHFQALRNFLVRNVDNKIVFRPDSGDPVQTTLEVFRIIEELVPYTIHKGYKVLSPKFGVLWGDGLNYDKIKNILFALKEAGWASSNIVFGMGGGLHSEVTRDTQRFAFKSSAQCRDGIWYDVFKDPVDSSKKSKKGRLALVKNNGFKTIQLKELDNQINFLAPIFKDGKLLMDQKWENIRKRASI